MPIGPPGLSVDALHPYVSDERAGMDPPGGKSQALLGVHEPFGIPMLGRP